MTSRSQTGARDPLRFIVLQPGARMNYAVPALLARAGMLERFYTDICADVGPLRYLGPMWPERMRPRPVALLLGRRLPRGIPAHVVRQVPLASFANLALRRFPHRQRQLNGWTEPDGRMIERVRRDGFASADALYTVLINSDLDLVREAQARGIRTVHEVMIGPDVGHWVRAEQALVPGIEESVLPEQIRAGSERDARKYELSDLILVPSEFVRRSVLGLGADPERIATVPYGLDESWLDQISEPVPGRVLFVGSVGLRKGSHHLAAACRLLERRRVACEVRVVTTPNCGSAVRDGVDGFIVPIRDAEAIADKVELLLSDRELRARMGRSARERAREFTWERYGERLLAALNRLA